MRESYNQRDKSKLGFWPALIFVVLVSLLVAGLSYWFVRMTLIQQDLENYELTILRAIETTGTNIEIGDARALVAAGLQISREDRISRVVVYDTNQNQLWFSQESWELSAIESTLLSQISPSDKNSSAVDSGVKRLFGEPSMTNLRSIFLPSNQSLSTLTWVNGSEGRRIGIIKSLRSYSDQTESAFLAAKLSFLTMLISSLLVFLFSSRPARREKRPTRKDQTFLNQQVSQLSELLNENKDGQKNMKSANSRAVELNERFLRRVGADLHDGPAQEIGYAVMRLNQIAGKQDSKELGQEFFAIKQALEDSLKEIREISTGLVMPELEEMTLQEGVNKVVERYQINTGTEVKETYINLPDEIELPVKICAYRFAQEGLNNAYKHGQAKKCRFTAQLVNDVLHLSLKDDGIGFRKSELSTDGGHLGLMGLKDRIESLGGKLSINSELGVGTAIKVSIQLGDTIT